MIAEVAGDTLQVQAIDDVFPDAVPPSREAYWRWRVTRLEAALETAHPKHAQRAWAYAEAGDASRALESLELALEARAGQVMFVGVQPAWVDAPVRAGVPRGYTLPSSEGQTTLGFAAPACADRLVEHLLKQGADPNALTERGSPVLAAAAGKGCPRTVGLLLAAGAEVDADSLRGGTPLEQ